MAETDDKYRNLSEPEKARLAGAIWIYGSINVEHSRERGYYLPRLVLSMPNPLPLHYAEDTGGSVYRDGKRYTLIVKKQRALERILRDIRPFLSGIEKEQIEIALEIIDTNRNGKLSKDDRKDNLTRLCERWKDTHNKLQAWVAGFKKRAHDARIRTIPKTLHGLWNKGYVWDDC